MCLNSRQLAHATRRQLREYCVVVLERTRRTPVPHIQDNESRSHTHHRDGFRGARFPRGGAIVAPAPAQRMGSQRMAPHRERISDGLPPNANRPTTLPRGRSSTSARLRPRNRDNYPITCGGCRTTGFYEVATALRCCVRSRIALWFFDYFRGLLKFRRHHQRPHQLRHQL